MRFYSDKILTWNEVLRAAYAARANPGRWLNTHIYKIQSTQPAVLHSSSPIELLQTNRKYYVYDNLLYNNTCERLGNYIDVVRGKNGRPGMHIYLPFTVAPHDVIVIHDDTGGHVQQVVLA